MTAAYMQILIHALDGSLFPDLDPNVASWAGPPPGIVTVQSLLSLLKQTTYISPTIPSDGWLGDVANIVVCHSTRQVCKVPGFVSISHGDPVHALRPQEVGTRSSLFNPFRFAEMWPLEKQCIFFKTPYLVALLLSPSPFELKAQLRKCLTRGPSTGFLMSFRPWTTTPLANSYSSSFMLHPQVRVRLGDHNVMGRCWANSSGETQPMVSVKCSANSTQSQVNSKSLKKPCICWTLTTSH